MTSVSKAYVGLHRNIKGLVQFIQRFCSAFPFSCLQGIRTLCWISPFHSMAARMEESEEKKGSSASYRNLLDRI